MRLIYTIFILLLVLMTSAQCQQTAADWFNKGDALTSQGKYDEAIQAYDQAIQLNPNYDNAWYNKGVALKALGRTNESDAAFVKAKELANLFLAAPKIADTYAQSSNYPGYYPSNYYASGYYPWDYYPWDYYPWDYYPGYYVPSNLPGENDKGGNIPGRDNKSPAGDHKGWNPSRNNKGGNIPGRDNKSPS